ncbi:ABC transporter substrate-binding protein [Paenibacillus sp. 1P07SE]|uniref:ABC transporter substrate-binding protein n=1 Tax=Paenibacillus sp. 1P07SE TaxID=3132209 RepID=UPI0039A5B4D3
MKMNKSKAWLIPTMLVLTLIGSACSGNQASPNSGNKETNSSAVGTEEADQDKAQEPVTIEIFAKQNAAEAVAPDHPILLEIEKELNAKLDITWIPTNTIIEKTKVTLASGDIPELMYIEDPKDPLFHNATSEGAFWDLTEVYKEYPNLAAYPAEAWENSKINGRNYGVPRPRPLEGGGTMPMLRKDWLDNLGLEMPVTLDEIYAVAKAFTEQDPDGNHQNDTYGIIGDVAPNHMGSLGWVEKAYTLSPNAIWKLEDGNLAYTAFDPNIKKALEFLKKAYEEKVLSPDFAVLKHSQSRDMFMGNKGGILGSAVKPQWLFMEALLKIEPEGDIYPLPYVESEVGRYAEKGTGFYGMYSIPKTVPEAKLKRILEVLDRGAQDDIGELAAYGFKDTHYTVAADDPTYIQSTEQATSDNIAPILNNLSNIFTYYSEFFNGYYPGIPQEQYNRNKQILQERAAVSVSDPTVGILSPTYEIIGPDIEKNIQDMKINIIMGKSPMSAWDDLVERLKSDTQLEKAIEEMKAAYKDNVG